jgi:predicted esterase
LAEEQIYPVGNPAWDFVLDLCNLFRSDPAGKRKKTVKHFSQFFYEQEVQVVSDVNKLQNWAMLLIFLICCSAYAQTTIGKNSGDFVFEYKIAGQVKKIPVYYFCPAKLSDTSRIVIVLHGSGRTGKVYRDEWRSHATQYNFLVLCPEFSEIEFPGWAKYQGGNIYDYEKKQYTPRQDWTFNVIEGLFDFVKNDRSLKTEAYCLFGHSAGAQFVHRMVLCMPEARFSMAISCGAGDYTEPTLDKTFREGLRGTGVTTESLKKSLQKRMIILMGDKDYVSKTMPKSPEAFNQYDRVWMAKLFFQAAKKEAEKLNVKLNWTFQFVPNADHNSRLHDEYGSRFAANSKLFLSDSNSVNSASDHKLISKAKSVDVNSPQVK